MKKHLILLLTLLTLSITSVYGEGITGSTSISDIGIYKNTAYDSSVVEVLKLDSRVEILKESGIWYMVKTEGGKTGWVEKAYINSEPSKYVQNNESYNINIRKGPSTSSETVGKLNPGQKLKYVDTYHSWHLVEYKNNEYYVASWLTDLVYQKSQKTFILYDKTNVRNEPSAAGKVIGQGNKGDSYKLIGEEAGWFKIEFVGGKTGYVASWLVANSSNVEVLDEGEITYKTSSVKLNLRASSNLKGKKIMTLPLNEKVKVLSSEKGWDKVLTKDGKIGWCDSSFLNSILPLSGKKILLDPGHGGKDPGSISGSGKYEKFVNYDQAEKIKEKLEMFGAEVFMTRTSDTYINNTARGRMAEKLGVDLLLSIHHNSLGNSDYFGFSAYYNTIKFKDAKLGYDIAEAVYLSANTMNGVYRDGIFDRNYEVLRESNVPSALVEIGFMSNPWEEQNIHDESYQNAIAAKIAEGIVNYFN